MRHIVGAGMGAYYLRKKKERKEKYGKGKNAHLGKQSSIKQRIII